MKSSSTAALMWEKPLKGFPPQMRRETLACPRITVGIIVLPRNPAVAQASRLWQTQAGRLCYRKATGSGRGTHVPEKEMMNDER